MCSQPSGATWAGNWERQNGMMDSYAMSAGEAAIRALSEYGYMEEVGEGRSMGRWTDAGKALLKWNYHLSEQKNKPFPMPPIATASSRNS